jgi:pSer/pThr/pTyr-binding forkhead associated (FHA) protein
MSPPPPPPPGTVFETDEEILEALRANKPAPPVPTKPRKPGAVPAAPMDPSGSALAVPVPIASARLPTPGHRSVELYRPTSRPPIALLVVCDDGRTEGEIVRIRSDRFIIGRVEGDFVIPHDPLISARHLEITRQLASGRYRWVVTDLQSMNGLFVRVSRAVLSDQGEFLVGRGRYRLEAPGATTVDHVPAIGTSGSTRDWSSDPSPMTPPALVELVPGGIGNRYVLTRPEYWIGTDPTCAICRPDDPFCEPRHVHLHRDPSGGWHAEHKKSQNGLWLRVPQISSEKSCIFQIGEQRFRLVMES